MTANPKTGNAQSADPPIANSLIANPLIERVIAMTERLTRVLEADIAALEKSEPQAMRSIEPEMQQLAALYAREAQALRVQLAQSGTRPPEKLTTATRAFGEALQRQTRLLTRVKNASEGMVRAIAEEVDKRRTAARPYAPAKPQSRQPSALIYNGVA